MFRLALIFGVVAVANAAVIPPALKPILDGRIVGGWDTPIEDVPWQVSITVFEFHHCGGSIINKNTILTANHCLLGAEPGMLAVRAGATLQSSGGVSIPVEKFVGHPDFNPRNFDYDVAIIWLKEDLQFSSQIQPIRMADLSSPLPYHKKGLVSGWGLLNSTGRMPEHLQSVLVPVLTPNECRRFHGSLISDKMICAAAENGGVDACRADSGGPFVVDDMLYGVVSWGIDCALAEFPGVYANVAALREWIDLYVKQ